MSGPTRCRERAVPPSTHTLNGSPSARMGYRVPSTTKTARPSINSVIPVRIQPSQDWNTLKREIESSFLNLGVHAGDDPNLIVKNTARAYRFIRNIGEKVPIAPLP